MTDDYKRVRRALLLVLVLGCKGRIGVRDDVPVNDDAVEVARSHEQGPTAHAASTGVTPRRRASLDGGVQHEPSRTELVQRQRFQCKRPESRGSAQLAARRLTRDEYLSSAQTALGVDISKLPEVEQVAAQIPAETVGDITREFQNMHAYDHVAGILMTSQALARAVVSDPQLRTRVFGECAKEEDTQRDCVADFLQRSARRILKRPLEPSRVDALLVAFSNAGEPSDGLRLVLARLLQAPEAVFHLSLPRQHCTAAADDSEHAACEDEAAHDGKIAVDAWTVAARMAYALTGRGPDDPLLGAAERDELRTLSQLRPHALRMLQTPDARRQLESILDAWLSLQTLPTPTQAAGASAGIDVLDLSNEARSELIDYALYEILDREADAQTLMTAQVGFPRSHRMAKLYGTATPVSGDKPATLPNGHRGLLLRVAPLMSGQLRTSPIMRGVYVRKRLLCDQLASPDFSVVQARTQALQDMDPKQLSSRQIAEQITAPAECMACHTQINPLGFALEGFDAVGSPRQVEIDVDIEGRQLGQHAIDTSVTKANIEEGGPEQIADALELVQTLATSTKYKACIAERLYTHAQLRPPAAADDCVLSEIEAALHEGKSVKEAWLAAVVNEDIFVRKAPETPP